MNHERLLELQNKIYSQNVKMGWHDEPRSFNTYICLFHSELSEAMEGDRKNLMDDHLPQYEMCAVEVADFIIRVLDWFGSVNIQDAKICIADTYMKDNVDFLAAMHSRVSNAHDCQNLSVTMELECALGVALKMAEFNHWPLEKIILEKVEYNKTRADHKRENRAKSNGKKY